MTPAPPDDAPSRANDDSAPTGPVSGPVSGVLDLREAASVRRYAPGEVMGEHYTIVEEIGSGGMGVVYKAVDRRLGQAVALKLLRPRSMTDAGIARFRRELALAQRVSHANVCRLHGLGDEDGVLYITMQHVEGQRLDHLILAMGHLSPKQTVAFARQLCAGLSAIHDQGIVHRDLKPSNIMVDRSGHLYIMDFGLAVRPMGGDRVTSTGAVLGTLAYLSPEQARGSGVTGQSDIYALGLILFEMLTGRCPPGDTNTLPLALRETSETCPPPSSLTPEVPPGLDDIVLRCLQRDRAQRFPSAANVLAALEGEQAHMSTGSGLRQPGLPLATVPPVTSPLTPGRRRSRWLMGAVIGAVLVMAVVGVLRLRGTSPPLPRVGDRPPAIAVMPFQFTGPEDAAYLKNLLPLLLSERLRRSTDLEIAPFSSARTLGSTEAMKSVAQQLGVAAAIYGDLVGKDGHVTLSLRMMRPDVPEPMWTETIEADADHIVPRAEEKAPEIARAAGSRWKSEADATTVRMHDPKALALYLEGRTLLEGWDVKKNDGRAAEAFEKAIALDPALVEAHAGRALALWRGYESTHDTALVEQALAEAQRAVGLDPGLPEAHVAIGYVYLGMGRSAEAAAAFEKAQALAPADDAVCRWIALAYEELGRHEEAERLLRRAVELKPSYWGNYVSLGQLLITRGHVPEAKECYRRVIDLRPESDIGYANLAGVDLMTGDFAAAEPLLKAALKIQSTPRAHGNLGFVYYAVGRYEDAAREFKEATVDSPRAPDFGNLGDAYRQLGHREDARAAYQKAVDLADSHLRVNPSDSEYRAAEGMWLGGLGRCRDALREAGQAARQTPNQPAILYYAAVTSALCRDGNGALDFARRAMALGAASDIKTNPDLLPILQSTEAGRDLLKATIPAG
jgi:serine/threonine protein kinase/tetratricopeptide (TPR) repeat protein